jgi:hypothetical protein
MHVEASGQPRDERRKRARHVMVVTAMPPAVPVMAVAALDGVRRVRPADNLVEPYDFIHSQSWDASTFRRSCAAALRHG